MDSSSPKYVITTPLSSETFDPDAIIGHDASSTERNETRAWPLIPASFEPPSPELQHAVKEVAYITKLLDAHAGPLPGDDVECMSDLMLSLETRADVTKHVLLYTNATQSLNRMAPRLEFHGSPETVALSRRAKKLAKHWGDDLSDGKEDEALQPLLASVPDTKPSGWVLELSDESNEIANKLLAAIMKVRQHSSSYFRVHPPKPMAWHPANDKAWNTTSRTELETGDLYFNPNWTPIYMDYGLQAMDVPWQWKNPDWDEKEADDYEKHQNFLSLECGDLMSGMTIQRKDILKIE